MMRANLPLQVAEDLQRLRISRSASRENGAAHAEPAQSGHAAREGDAAACCSHPRWPEYTGAFLLYFVCVPPTPQVGLRNPKEPFANPIENP